MINIIIRTILIFLIMMVIIRLMGKRQAGQLQPYELVFALIISEVASTPMDSPGTPLSYGLVPAITLLLLYYAISFFTERFKFFRRVVCGEPSILIHEGKLISDEINKQHYNISDLLEQLRLNGYTNIADIHYAILETNGQISVFPYAKYAPATPEDLDIEVIEEGISTALVIDGEFQPLGLKHLDFDEKKTASLLHTLGFSYLKMVVVFTLSTNGEAFIQDKNGNTKHTFLPPEVMRRS